MKTMPNSNQEERLRWIMPIVEKEISVKTMSVASPFSERTLKYWLADYRKNGLSGLTSLSTRPKSQPNETPIWLKEKILSMRQEHDLAAIKLHWKLKKEGIDIHERTIGKILKANGLTRKYRSRKIQYKKPRIQFKPGELIEIDIKFVPNRINGKRYFQFTAIDVASKWRYLEIFDDYGNYASIKFLNRLMQVAPFRIQAIKTDNGSNFTNRYTGYKKSADPTEPNIHPFDTECQKLNIEHYLIDPGKPQQNAFVENSHKSDQLSFYGRIKCTTKEELSYQSRLWNMFYNDLEHCGLNGLTPNEFLKLKVQNVRT
jgi:transposase InsO family protein